MCIQCTHVIFVTEIEQCKVQLLEHCRRAHSGDMKHIQQNKGTVKNKIVTMGRKYCIKFVCNVCEYTKEGKVFYFEIGGGHTKFFNIFCSVFVCIVFRYVVFYKPSTQHEN